ncbi:MAG: hypothetical protein JW864_03665 [Spirochaetes bacterium]|nr:hypothetical protein [Spirochaetota bacterium]
MKIDINNEIIITGGVKRHNLNKPVKDSAGTKAAGNIPVQDVQNISNSKAYIDAVAISQMAWSFFQTAYLISSSLRKIANDAVLTGSIDQDELNKAMTGINASLSGLQEEGPAVLNALQQNNISAFGFTRADIDVPEAAADLVSLEEAASVLSAGEKPDLKRIDRINDNFFNNGSKLNDFVNSFSAGFSLSGIRNIDADSF